MINISIQYEFDKNKDIINSEKFKLKRAIDIEDLEEMKMRIYDKKENSIVVFHTEWCPHW